MGDHNFVDRSRQHEPQKGLEAATPEVEARADVSNCLVTWTRCLKASNLPFKVSSLFGARDARVDDGPAALALPCRIAVFRIVNDRTLEVL